MILEIHIPLAKRSKSLLGMWEDPVVSFHLLVNVPHVINLVFLSFLLYGIYTCIKVLYDD